MDNIKRLFDIFLNLKDDEKLFLAWTAYLAFETKSRGFIDRMHVLALCTESDYEALREIYDKINPQLSFVEMKIFLCSDKIESWQKEFETLEKVDMAVFIVMILVGTLRLFTIEDAKITFLHFVQS